MVKMLVFPSEIWQIFKNSLLLCKYINLLVINNYFKLNTVKKEIKEHDFINHDEHNEFIPFFHF